MSPLLRETRRVNLHFEIVEEATGLALSGGGFRAAVFHLGALERLVETEVVRWDITRVAGVSGGSIVTAFLARCQKQLGDEPGGDPLSTLRQLSREDWRKHVTLPLLQHLRVNHRTGLPKVRLIGLVRPRSAGDAFVAQFDRWLTGGMKLGDLPALPSYVFGATDLVTGEPFQLGSPASIDVPGAERRLRHHVYNDPNMPVARAVAASCAFPTLIPPIRLLGTALGDSTARAKDAELVDGGLCDNLGLEALLPAVPTVLISDGGGTTDRSWQASRVLRPLRYLKRYADISDGRSRDLQRQLLRESSTHEAIVWSIDPDRWLNDDERFEAAQAERLRVGDFEAAEPRSRFTHATAKLIAGIRTDIDGLEDWEVILLLNHGYLECAAALEESKALVGWPSKAPDETPPIPSQGPACLSPDAELEIASAMLEHSGEHGVIGRPFERRTVTSSIRVRARLANRHDKLRRRGAEILRDELRLQ